jgi:asparaginyl-tRNA synthetase
MQKMDIKNLFQQLPIGKQILVNGWVRTKRQSKNVTFITLSDGTCNHTLQAVIEPNTVSEDVLSLATTGAGIALSGHIIESLGKGQQIELVVSEIRVYGTADPELYPLQPKKHSLEFLREIAHLRPRTQTFGAIFRIRHTLAYAIHKYFNDNGFFYWHSPIITGSDCEGAGEMFRVSTFPHNQAPLTEDGNINFREDFFGRETNLTVSGQLEGELGAMGLSKIYTFGPTFRAENSNTARHLAEFWMIEPEVAFYDLIDNMDLAEDFLKYLIQYVLEHCAEDLSFLDKRFAEEEAGKKQEDRSDMGLLDKLRFVTKNNFERLTYSEAISILLDSKPYKKKQFKYPIAWGADLQSEHERYLVEKHFKKPVILTHYPKEIKAFYMKLNEDGKTVNAMDVLFPGIGEIIGGSQREDDYEKLASRIREVGILEQDIWWYLDTRRFGSVPHSGFGLGFERIVLFVTGMANIRDVIPFPRTPQNAQF